MDIFHASKKIKPLKQQFNLVLFFLIALLISNCILAYWVGYAYTQQRTVIVPLNLNSKAMVSPQAVDAQYLETVALALLQSRYTLMPDTVRDQYQTLLHHTYPTFYRAFKKALDIEARRIKKEKFSQVLYIQTIEPNTKKLTVSAEGLLKRFAGELNLPDAHMRYTLHFKLQNTRLWLTHIDSKEIYV